MIGSAADLVQAIIPRRLHQPASQIEWIHSRQAIPKAQQHFLRGILGIGLVCQQRMRKAVDLITMPLAQNSEFNLAYHLSSHTTRDREILLQRTQFLANEEKLVNDKRYLPSCRSFACAAPIRSTAILERIYVLESSTDLVNWVPIYTNGGSSIFADPQATNYALRLYRAVLP